MSGWLVGFLVGPVLFFVHFFIFCIFFLNVTRLVQTAFLKARNSDAGDFFGFSAALSRDGNTLAVGARQEDSNAVGVNGDQANNLAPNSGSVFVFERINGYWQQQAYIKASDTGAGDWFGDHVAISGDGKVIAANARFHGPFNSGAVYVFELIDGNWTQQALVKASNEGSFDWFGWSIGLSANGTTIVVGTYAEDSNGVGVGGSQTNNLAIDSGAVYLLERQSGGSWFQTTFVKSSNSDPGDYFGQSVAISGDGRTVAVGAPREGSNATGINQDQNNNLSPSSGAVYILTKSSGGVWTQTAYLKSSRSDIADGFGHFVAISGNGQVLAVAAPYESSNSRGVDGDESNNNAASSGACYIFQASGTSWSQQAYLKASNSDSTDQFSTSVGLNWDGSILSWVLLLSQAGQRESMEMNRATRCLTQELDICLFEKKEYGRNKRTSRRKIQVLQMLLGAPLE